MLSSTVHPTQPRHHRHSFICTRRTPNARGTSLQIRTCHLLEERIPLIGGQIKLVEMDLPNIFAGHDTNSKGFCLCGKCKSQPPKMFTGAILRGSSDTAQGARRQKRPWRDTELVYTIPLISQMRWLSLRTESAGDDIQAVQL